MIPVTVSVTFTLDLAAVQSRKVRNMFIVLLVTLVGFLALAVWAASDNPGFAGPVLATELQTVYHDQLASNDIDLFTDGPIPPLSDSVEGDYTLVQTADVTGYAAASPAAVTNGIDDTGALIVVGSGIVFGPYTVVTPVTVLGLLIHDGGVTMVIPLVETWTINTGEILTGSVVCNATTGEIEFVRDTN